MSYASTHQHLLAELDRVDAILAAYEPSERPAPPEDSVEADTERLIRKPGELPLALPPEDRRRVSELTDDIGERCRQTDARLRLRVLVETCGLSRRHLDVLLLALAPELGETYRERFQRAHDRQSLGRPTPGFIERLFGRTRIERLAAGALIGGDSPLRRHDLIQLQSPPDSALGARSRLITVPERIVDYLRGDDSVDPKLDATLDDHAQGGHVEGGLVDTRAAASFDSLAVDDERRDRLAAVADSEGHDRYYWYGPASEKHRAVEAVCTVDRYLKADLTAVLDADALDRLRREAALLGRPLHLYNSTAATNRPETPTLEAVFDAFVDLDTPVFVTGDESWTPTGRMARDVDAVIEFPYPSVDLRREFWTSHEADLPAEVEPRVLAGTFRLTHEQLRAALSTARSVADGEPTADDIYTGCTAQSTSELGDLADRIEPDSDWEAIQLRPETERELRLVRTHIAQQARIYGDWGFGEAFSRGTGVVALFEGPSGTGKTMAAEILAGDVGMDLYRIDLSSVVSKYIGETEEKLEEIFEAATNANAILLFDEADAVFGERSEVSDATDRYANAEVNYLLQRIERYDGVVLLTTNYASAIDSAFQRRLDHTVSFKAPQQSTRRAIWQEIFPADAPLGDLDDEFLSSFEFTGGQIKQIAQTAAIQAANEAQSGESTEETIEMRHLVAAVQRAFEASGRMVDPSTYDPYQHLLSGARSTADESDPSNASDDSQPAAERPETVVRSFVDRLDSGDPAVHDLYHDRAVVDPVSRKELRRAKTVDYSIVGEIDRVHDESGRTVVAFTQQRDGSTREMRAELRPKDDGWRLFDLQRRASVGGTDA